MVSTKRLILGGSLSSVSATRSAVGSVAFELAVENAMTLASRVSRKNAIGLFPATNFKSSGKTPNICRPSASSTTPT